MILYVCFYEGIGVVTMHCLTRELVPAEVCLLHVLPHNWHREPQISIIKETQDRRIRILYLLVIVVHCDDNIVW